jgi:putative sigma-54 modulation protein
MHLDIRGLNVRLTERMRLYVQRRVDFALSRFGVRVIRVRVCLSDLSGPRRTVDRVCEVMTTVRGAGPLVVEQREARLTVAVDHALDRVARQVARTMERIDVRWVDASGLGTPRVRRKQGRSLTTRRR